jgi:SNF2 family DNA or RNA helicase
MLRRLKKDVLSSIQIPTKTEVKILVPLTEMQVLTLLALLVQKYKY